MNYDRYRSLFSIPMPKSHDAWERTKRDPLFVELERRFQQVMNQHLLFTGGYDWVFDQIEKDRHSQFQPLFNSEGNVQARLEAQYIEEHRPNPEHVIAFLNSLVVVSTYNPCMGSSEVQFIVHEQGWIKSERSGAQIEFKLNHYQSFWMDSVHVMQISRDDLSQWVLEQFALILFELFMELETIRICNYKKAVDWYRSYDYESTFDKVLVSVRVNKSYADMHLVVPPPPEFQFGIPKYLMSFDEVMKSMFFLRRDENG